MKGTLSVCQCGEGVSQVSCKETHVVTQEGDFFLQEGYTRIESGLVGMQGSRWPLSLIPNPGGVCVSSLGWGLHTTI